MEPRALEIPLQIGGGFEGDPDGSQRENALSAGDDVRPNHTLVGGGHGGGEEQPEFGVKHAKIRFRFDQRVQVTFQECRRRQVLKK